jgi:hypothetical protein
MRLKKENEGIVIKELDEMIKRARAAMTQEDVAWVEKQFGE